jgi:hypothetical protein
MTALGFRLHTGWAAMVAVSADYQVYLRRRVELLDSGMARFVYHAAAEMELTGAEELIRRTQDTAQGNARKAVADALGHLRSQGVRPVACGVAVGSSKVPGDLAAIIASHALIHAAEGALFQRAVIAASEQNKLTVTATREKQLWVQADPELRKRIEQMRNAFGPPWSADQKIAAAAALAALQRR